MFYLSSFSVSSLISISFFLMIAFLIISIKNKSKASFHLGIAYGLFSIFSVGYFIAASVYHPMSAYHRYLTLGSILFIVAHLNVSFFYFPDERHPRAAKYFLIANYIISIGFITFFIAKTIHAPKIYYFLGHYWDFNAAKANSLGSLYLMLLLFVGLLLMIWRIVTSTKKTRIIVLVYGLSYITGALVPSLVNAITRTGSLDREAFYISLTLFNLLGFFLMSMVYINNVKDRTSFIDKLIGISLVTFLMMLQFLSYFSLTDREDAFDKIQYKTVEILLLDNQYPDNLQYIDSYSMNDGKFSKKFGEVQTIETAPMEYLYINTYIYESIKIIPVKDFRNNLTVLINNTYPAFAGYKNAITVFADNLPADEKYPAVKLIKHIESLKRPVLVNYNKIKSLPEENFRTALLKYLKAEKIDNRKIDYRKDVFGYFRTELIKQASSSTLNGKDLKQNILNYLIPMNPAGTRIYRSASGISNHLIAYQKVNTKEKTIYEAGFPYAAYRSYIHPAVLKICIMLFAILLVIRFGFKLFFSGVLIKPLKSLSLGVEAVNSGNLNSAVPVIMEDEIGSVTRAFNGMVDSVRESKEKLQDYADTLEEKVRVRTEELQAAIEEMEAMNDKLIETHNALWGEMELAKKIQMKLLPENPTMADYEITAYMKPADEVGGDYYDIINVAGMDWIVIGDVSGHGVPAGLIMMMVQTAIHITLDQNPDISPDTLLDIINRTISKNIKQLGEDKYMTITVLAATKGGSFLFSGLHQDILIYRAATGHVDIIETQGIWIGVIDDIKGMLQVDGLSMAPGDVMILYSDGITEAGKKGDIVGVVTEEFGDKKLAEFFKSFANLPVDSIKNAILDELENYICKDDVTMVILRRKV